jgi:hypothetical protein
MRHSSRVGVVSWGTRVTCSSRSLESTWIDGFQRERGYAGALVGAALDLTRTRRLVHSDACEQHPFVVIVQDVDARYWAVSEDLARLLREHRRLPFPVQWRVWRERDQEVAAVGCTDGLDPVVHGRVHSNNIAR